MDLNSAGADVVRKMLDEMVLASLEFGYPFDPRVEFSIILGEDVYHFSLGVHFKTGKHTEESFKMLPKWREVDEH